MAKITPQMVEEAYKIAIQVYKGQIHKNKGTEILAQYKMNETSAMGYIDNINYMLKGERYYWKMKPYDTGYFLSMIKKDFGQVIYEKALYAKKQHEEKKSGNIGRNKNRQREINFTINKSKHSELKDEFEDWMVNIDGRKKPVASTYASAIDKISQHFSNETGIKTDIYLNKDIKVLIGICEEYKKGGKFEDFGNERNGLYRAAIKKYVYFLKKTVSGDNNGFDDEDSTLPTEDAPEKIVKQTIELMRKINQICKYNKKRKIFKSEAFEELREEIEYTCISKNDFKNFANNLYMIIRETTRYDNPSKKPPYDYMFPDEFMKEGTSTKVFWYDVNTIRCENAHIEKGKIADMYEKYLGKDNRMGPKLPEDWKKLQIKVLEHFEKAMERLHEIVETNPNSLK